MAPVKKRSPRQNYFEMGLNQGDPIIFEQLPKEAIHVASEHKLYWRDHEISLSALRRRLGAEQGKSMYSGRILANGRDLDTLYNETYRQAAPPIRRKR